MAVFGIIRTDLSCTPQFLKALCLDVVVPGVFGVPIEMIVIDGELTVAVIHDVCGSLTFCAARIGTARIGTGHL